jgi:hypothetical protein
MLVWLLEEQQLGLIRLDRQTRPSQPFLTDRVPGSEQPFHVPPVLGSCKEDAVVHIHA